MRLPFGKTTKISSRLTFWSALGAMGLHRDMRVQVIQGAVCLLAALESTFVHAFDFLVAASRALMLLGTGDRNERVYLAIVSGDYDLNRPSMQNGPYLSRSRWTSRGRRTTCGVYSRRAVRHSVMWWVTRPVISSWGMPGVLGHVVRWRCVR